MRVFQRTGRDSNPRYAFDVHTISNRALSTTQTPAQSKTYFVRTRMGARPIYAKSAHNASLKFQKGVFFGVLVAKIAFFALSISSIYPIRIRFCGKTEKMCRL